MIRSPKFTTKVYVWPRSLLNSLVEGTTLLNTMTKCGGIEPERILTHAFEQRAAGITKIYQSPASGRLGFDLPNMPQKADFV